VPASGQRKMSSTESRASYCLEQGAHENETERNQLTKENKQKEKTKKKRTEVTAITLLIQEQGRSDLGRNI
jgi:hypothetical protein